MEVVFALCLPRDEASVPFVRHMCRSSLERLGVTEDCISDTELVVSEACTNVLRHADDSEDEYEVKVEINYETCVISVIDRGTGFDHATVPVEVAADSAEGGRGIYLMRALVDRLDVSSDPDTGTLVQVRKGLQLKDDSILKLLVQRQNRQEPGGATHTNSHRISADGDPTS